MDYKLLIIDDDDMMHFMLDKLLGEDYELVHAKDAQEGIDIISNEVVNLLLVDIHMPSVSGLDFLEALGDDSQKEQIPVLIMTAEPTAEKAQSAADLGAADFIDKTEFIQDKDQIRERIQMKLVTDVEVPHMDHKTFNKKKLVSKLMDEVLVGDFISSSRKLFTELMTHFSVDFVSFWTFNNKQPNLIISLGTELLHNYGPDEFKKEHSLKYVFKNRKPYYTNNVYRDELGISKELSQEEELPAEIGIPLFALTDKELIKNNKKIPPKTKIFGMVILKRNQLFTTKEYKAISRLVIQSGTILWRLFKQI
ncbi:Response regulator receiver domain-containing protein [Fodinibius salinus]|uniref:Response regulator receiver domain-containing protein n=1 Tax=Fodinibius salinus TaxID=860790 RepID=A0A5D3YN16_9BACT|nr:response regulator [Fodinibius salinus]TYP94117.1 Response regulator receiver domain-containing protein [Fodinibius salinus]